MRSFTLLTLAVSVMFSFFAKPSGATSPVSAYEFSFMGVDGTKVGLSDYAGKTLLIVNTASKCGFTPQYDGLEKLYQSYKDRGLVILAIPSNDFGGQEPGTAQEIVHFCQTTYDITFPVMAKTVVSGKDAHPFYKWAAAQKKGGFIFSKPRWNFHKYLVTPQGQLAGSYGSNTKPGDPGLIKDIEANLP